MATQSIPEEEITAAFQQLAKGLRDNKATIDLLTELTSRIDPADIAPFESYLRWKVASLQHTLSPQKSQFWSAQPDFPTWMSVASANGYERENGILGIRSGAPNAIFLALLVRRLNDWVPQVRAAAEKKIVAIAKDTDPHIVATVLCTMLSRWNSWRRWSNSEKHKLIELVELEQVSIAICERIKSSFSGPMALVLSQACRCEALDKELPAIAIEAVQPAVRAKAYRMLLEQKAIWLEGRKWKWTDIRYSEGRYVPTLGERKLQISAPVCSTIENALKDQSVAVRRVGAEKFIQNLDGFGSRAEAIAIEIGSDKSNSVAERGRFAQRSLSTMNSSS